MTHQFGMKLGNRREWDEPSRRRFAVLSARALLGVGIVPIADGPLSGGNLADTRRSCRARSVIYLNLMGGMSHIDTFDPKPQSPDVQGPVRALGTDVPGIHVSEFLPRMAQQMHRVTVVRSMTSNQGSHPAGQYLLHRSHLQRGTASHPTLAAWAMRCVGKRNPQIPGCVSIAGNGDSVSSGFLDPQFAPVPIGNPRQGLPHSARPTHVDDRQFDRRLSLADSFNQSFRTQYDGYQQVRAHASMFAEAVRLMKSDDLKAFDISAEPAAVRDQYGESPFGQGCLLARRLVEYGVRFVEVGLNGWDTHYDNFGGVAKRASMLDRALSTLLVDLDQRGMLDDTLVVVGTEFGRTPTIVPAHSNGRDHHPKAFSCLMAGAGVRGGYVHGSTDASGADVVDHPVSIPDLNATIAWSLGMPIDEKFTAPSGQLFQIAEQGQPILEVFV